MKVVGVDPKEFVKWIGEKFTCTETGTTYEVESIDLLSIIPAKSGWYANHLVCPDCKKKVILDVMDREGKRLAHEQKGLIMTVVSHGCFRGSCLEFNLWREQVAKAAGIPIGLMEGWIDGEMVNLAVKTSSLWAKESLEKRVVQWLPLKWECLKPDILHVLLHHNDDTGYIEFDDLVSLAIRLEKVKPLVTNPYDWCDFQLLTDKFIAGLHKAAELNERVEFSS